MSIRRLAAGAGLALVLLGACEADVPATPAVDAFGTALQPLAPDPAFEEAARRECIRDGVVGQHIQLMPLAMQDRRTDNMAYLVFVEGGAVVECMLERRGPDYRMVAGGTGPLQQPGPDLAVTGTATVGERGLVVTGLVPAHVAAVVVLRDDGVRAQASIAQGMFVAWWSEGGEASTVIGYGVDGREISRVSVPRF